MPDDVQRPSFIVSTADVEETTHRYRDSDEPMAPSRAIGRAAGLQHVGLHVLRVPPGRRTSWPHAESEEEEFVFVLEGELDAWIDGALHHVVAGDLVAFPAGTGVCHTFLNDGTKEAKLLVGGDANKATNRIFYPHHPQRRAQLQPADWWTDIPLGPQGPHDGAPQRGGSGE